MPSVVVTPSPLLAPSLSALSGIRHGFFTREGGNAGFPDHEDLADVLSNRARIAACLGVAEPCLLSPFQTHSTDVLSVTESWRYAERPQGDALVTRQKGIAISVLTADCVPILFADATAGVIGAAHAGWKGALGGILEKTIAAMERLGARRSGIQAALGPCIWQNSYEVQPDFQQNFEKKALESRFFFKPKEKGDGFLFDLSGFVIARLQAAGIDRVAPSLADTYANPQKFFSHRFSTQRGEARVGNQLSAIFLDSAASTP